MLESVLAVTVVAALVTVMTVLFGKPPPLRTQRAVDTTATRPTPGAASPAVPPAPLPVLVLNNTRVAGLAARAAVTIRARNWPVRGTGNYRDRRVSVTTVYYAAGEEGVARLFATRFPAVRLVLPRPVGLPGTGLTVVLTRDFRP